MPSASDITGMVGGTELAHARLSLLHGQRGRAFATLSSHKETIAIWLIDFSGELCGAWILDATTKQQAQTALSILDRRAIIENPQGGARATLERLARTGEIPVHELPGRFALLADLHQAIQAARATYERAAAAHGDTTDTRMTPAWPTPLPDTLADDSPRAARLWSGEGPAPEAFVAAATARYLIRMWSETESLRVRRSYLREQFGDAQLLPPAWCDAALTAYDEPFTQLPAIPGSRPAAAFKADVHADRLPAPNSGWSNDTMGPEIVDQIGSDGALIPDADTTLAPTRKRELLLEALPEARIEKYAGHWVVRFHDQVILTKQVTHLGRPWEAFKKRIQIPGYWLDIERQGLTDGLTVRFVGVYHYGETTIFVDFDPTTYVKRKANNSAAHVSTNDLFQAQTLGQFSRQDKNGNQLTSLRADQFAIYLLAGYEEKNPHIQVFDRFSKAFLDGARIDGLAAGQEMYAAGWPDKFQPEWAGFYVEFRLSNYIRQHKLGDFVVVQKEKRKGEFDYDLRFLNDGVLEHYGDLKASNIAVPESPGNDQADFLRCLSETGRFWYVIFEHETWHGRNNGNVPTIAWNEWRRSVGHIPASKVYDSLSYSKKYKEAVRFVRVKILEVNQANVSIVLGEFQKGFGQYRGKGNPRKAKVSIKKKDIDNFLIYTKAIEVLTTP
ncbi:DUF6218 family protein [Knoellia aerolata]|uniref:Methylase-associated X1 domain-containing protein n=1 Tax=Knoellia aerolata DSM 18566 TaxID=1385519 RepID=A0A0A0JS93_9MICO|nr:DUF6218 family protein [Knoellia aerolata]KGN38942.1 hypothetical protein N801_19790 [Knoellia aerolata DSM 18566]